MKKKGKKKHLALILQNQPPIIAPVLSLCLENKRPKTRIIESKRVEF